MGGGDYRGLLVEHDLTNSAFVRGPEVQDWITRAQDVAALAHEPEVRPGGHCKTPYACGFAAHCRGGAKPAEYPVEWLPKQGGRAFKERIEDGAADMRDVEDRLLNTKQQRVKQHTLSNDTYFDAAGAAADLAPYGLPAWFIDFETISFTVPIWKETSPYQKIPFQFSVHKLEPTGELAHQAFLDLSGDDPSLAFAEALIGACGTHGPVFVYNAGFETGRIAELAARFPHLSRDLLAINVRVVDLLPIARERYYHPGQQGSWSIKRVLPAVAPDLRYDGLDGVQDGGAAMHAYVEAIDQGTSAARKGQIERQLLDYCHLDTLAMVRLWQFFAGQQSALGLATPCPPERLTEPPHVQPELVQTARTVRNARRDSGAMARPARSEPDGAVQPDARLPGRHAVLPWRLRIVSGAETGCGSRAWISLRFRLPARPRRAWGADDGGRRALARVGRRLGLR